MRTVILLESDRTVASCVKAELEKYDFKTVFASNADEAILIADSDKPDAVISDLAINSHSGSEFLYEFRTYTDWKDIPIILFSSIQLSDDIIASNDFTMLKIHDFLYKPKTSLDTLSKKLLSAVS